MYAAKEAGRGRFEVFRYDMAREFGELFREVANWGRWAARPEVGALNHLTADRVAAAARLVRQGVGKDRRSLPA